MKTNFNIFKDAIEPLRIPKDVSVFKDKHSILDSILNRKIKILIVVDDAISHDENSGFGVGRIVKLFSEEKLGCYRFEVDIATRKDERGQFQENPNPEQFEARYVNFSFDSTADDKYILDRYHEVFLFGFAPDNFGQTDDNIINHPWYSTDEELEVLHEWMNNGGGVFATGDHDYLGATMCSRIPRVGTMREWTNDDGVPPISGENRLDTNQPAGENQENGSEVIGLDAERDDIPQVIEWIPFRQYRVGSFWVKKPHEILCHPEHGVINVMPDHPHEGRCVEPDKIKLNESVKFGNSKEYPSHGGVQPKPKIIAYGNILQRENHAKGKVNAARFPMISIYDGREKNDSNVGRVAVDSTWHHWFNLNITGLENADNKKNWEKIKRYYLNLAVWLLPKNINCSYAIVRPFWWTEGIREITRKTPVLEVGTIYSNALNKIFGPCGKATFIFDLIYKFDPRLFKLYEYIEALPKKPDFDPLGPYCLTCPPFEILENYLFGYIFRELEPLVKEINEVFRSDKQEKDFLLNHEQILKAIDLGAEKGCKVFREETFKSIDEVERTLR